MRNWIIQEVDNTPIRDSFGVPVAISKMLLRRGIPEDKIQDFLSCNPKETYDPFLFENLDAAVRVILEALDTGREIVIYGDYDADGVTATALLYGVFKNFSTKVDFYIPSRFVDGYGLNNAALEKISKKHPNALIVTVDCGSTSKDEVEYAKSIGFDVIVSDHHSFEEARTPDCLILNPKKETNPYPFKDLSGCGVAFKLAQGIQRICDEKDDNRFTKAQLNELLDLVAISTIADVVPLVGENRTLVKYGLNVINERRRRGLAALFDVLDIDGTISSDNVAYILAPNINALGRMGTAGLGVELLEGSTKSMAELYDLASTMIDNNKARRQEQDRTAKICNEALAKENCGDYFLVINAPGAHEGVAGIVAGNLKEQYFRPVFICTPNEEGVLKGTGRCIPGINLHELMAKHSDLFIRFGGHAGACGFSIKAEDFEKLRDVMQEEVKEILKETPDALTENLYIEKILEPGEKTLSFAKELQKLEPFGEANAKPIFCIMNAQTRNLGYMGSESQHARFFANCSDGTSVPCVLFKRASEYAKLLDSGVNIDVAGEITVNEYNGKQKLQMIVKDIRRSQN
ncbi:MAG: single-stranded-DNA-specific exonuclease RecJ [Bacillota bacterium]|nr:single-stranded-DNA-specific exonuclease RecJ [Bacillota bacterium]